jgi:hypothetical protein
MAAHSKNGSVRFCPAVKTAATTHTKSACADFTRRRHFYFPARAITHEALNSSL